MYYNVIIISFKMAFDELFTPINYGRFIVLSI